MRKLLAFGFGLWALGWCDVGGGIWGLGVVAAAQEMPDPSQIHGRAIPAPELASRTVTVRVVREAIGNNIAGQEVRVIVGGTIRTATTDDQGRAEFRELPQAAEARAEATVDGEQLVSEPFPVPSSGGLRVILVAGIERAAERRKQEEAAAAAAPATRGAVVIGGNSRVHMEFNDDTLRVFYLLEVVNNARTRVDIGGPLIIDLPRAAQGATILTGSSESASISGARVTVTGPFAAGVTSVQVGYSLDFDDSEFSISQVWPVPVQQVTAVVQQTGRVGVSSPQLSDIQEVRSNSGDLFLLGRGPGLQAGTPLAITLSNLPTRSKTPRYVALGLALAIAGVGVWLAIGGGVSGRHARRVLVARREQLLGELEQLESKRRANAVNVDRYTSRKQRLMAELEEIYGALDEVHTGPQGGGEGVAA